MPESLWKRLGPLELEVDSYELERLEQPVTRGFTRVTTVVHLHGGGEEGLGEDVTWYAEHHDREQAAGAILPLSGSHTIASFSGVLDMPDPHRRWAYESAALDLALRQAGTTLAAAVGREPRPAAFVASPRAGEPAPGGGRLRRRPRPRRAAEEGGGPPLARARPVPPLQARPLERVEQRA